MKYFLLFIPLLFAGCTDTVTDPRTIIFPESNVSYSSDIQPLFDLSCAYSGCHDSYTSAGNLNLTSYANLLQRAGMVHPGDSTRSTRLIVLRGGAPHPAVNDPPITENQIHGIAVWIQEGASNN